MAKKRSSVKKGAVVLPPAPAKAPKLTARQRTVVEKVVKLRYNTIIDHAKVTVTTAEKENPPISWPDAMNPRVIERKKAPRLDIANVATLQTGHGTAIAKWPEALKKRAKALIEESDTLLKTQDEEEREFQKEQKAQAARFLAERAALGRKLTTKLKTLQRDFNKEAEGREAARKKGFAAREEMVAALRASRDEQLIDLVFAGDPVVLQEALKILPTPESLAKGMASAGLALAQPAKVAPCLLNGNVEEGYGGVQPLRDDTRRGNGNGW